VIDLLALLARRPLRSRHARDMGPFTNPRKLSRRMARAEGANEQVTALLPSAWLLTLPGDRKIT
jgi:hypothetical protein